MSRKCVVRIEDAECSFPVNIDRLNRIEAAGKDCSTKISDIADIVKMEDVFRIQDTDALRIAAKILLGIWIWRGAETYMTRQVQSRSTSPPSVISSIRPVLSMCQIFRLYLSQPSTQRSPFASHNSSPSCILHRQCPNRSYFLTR